MFSTSDRKDKTVKLTKNVWKNKILHPEFGHPEVKPYLSEIKEAVKSPEYVYQSIRDKRSKLYLKRITKNKFSEYFLLVVVKYVKEKNKQVGFVSTAFITKDLPKKGKRLND